MKEKIQQLISAEWQLEGMNAIIDENEIIEQSKMGDANIPFTSVLSEMLNSFLHQMESSESPRDILSLVKGTDLEDKKAISESLKSVMQKGAIYLFPRSYEEVLTQNNLPFGKEDLVRNFDDNWMFGFITPELPNWYFIGFVNRRDATDTYNTGFKKKSNDQQMKTFDLKDLPTNEIYQLLTGVITPRPIAFVSTISEEGVPNLAPYSYFNAFSSNPPIVAFSSNIQAGEQPKKDTLRNVEATKEVVINVVSYAISKQMAITNVNFPFGVNEFKKAGLTPVASELVRPFRVKESPVQMECKVQQIIPLGTKPGAGNIIICEVLKVHVEERVLDEKGRVNPHRIDLMGRLGRAYYVRASGEALRTIYQPRQELCIGFEHLPESAKNSAILTGNDLGQLAGLSAIPSSENITALRTDNSLSEALSSSNIMEALHKRAKRLLASEKTEEAANIVWLADEFV